ncbi:hypothetical protein CHELA40_11886 [Chelatococcus asaccharovorans]|nr:hypothetical protein CHELA40_11886 [Chelatococcus asaccharovorans]CAH1683865.1 hypothetical protein CHELA17_63713 [Chelatococcus asaccharovorans]
MQRHSRNVAAPCRRSTYLLIGRVAGRHGLCGMGKGRLPVLSNTPLCEGSRDRLSQDRWRRAMRRAYSVSAKVNPA